MSPASTCAVAWNHGAAPSLRKEIAAKHSHGAFIASGGVTIFTDTWSIGHASTHTESKGCAI
jgi:hypothetical protein